MSSRSNPALSYSESALSEALEQGEVVSVEIRQNTQVPTGRVSVHLKDGTQGSFAVSDVNRIQEPLELVGENPVGIRYHSDFHGITDT